jgi:hypothetical protein
MKMLVLCFLGVVGTAAGTVVFEGTMQHACQTGFMIAAGVTVLLWLLGSLD